MPTAFVPAPDAVETVSKLGQPELRPAAEAIAAAIPGFVPVHYGTMQASYRTSLDEQEDSIHVLVGSPFWHWMEYGTRFNPAYRPVQQAVAAAGLRYEAH